MSCALALAAALAATAPTPVTPAAPPAALAGEPLYADIVARAQALHREVAAFRGDGQRDAPTARPWPGLAGVKTQAAALAELDMRGHRDLAARGIDGDLKCILKGLAEDLPRKIEQLEAARTGADQDAALSDLLYLLDDNAGVLLAPPRPPA